MNEQQLQRLDHLSLYLNFDLSILNSALKDGDGSLEIYELEHFVKRIYQNSEKIRNIFDSEL